MDEKAVEKNEALEENEVAEESAEANENEPAVESEGLDKDEAPVVSETESEGEEAAETAAESEALVEDEIEAEEDGESISNGEVESENDAVADGEIGANGEAALGGKKRNLAIGIGIGVALIAVAVFLLVFLGGNRAVAAKVNGVEIYEDEVTHYIENQRAQSGLADKQEWGRFLLSYDLTPESLRKQIVDGMVDQELLRQGAASLGISADESQVNEYMDQMRSGYESDAQWREALDKAGTSEDSLRQSVKDMLLQQGISEYLQESAKPTEEETLEMAKAYASAYDGAKKSSHILIKVDSNADETAKAEARAKAEDILSQLESGSISFEDAAAAFSEDSGSAAKGGDVGWDCEVAFVEPYQTALDGLSVGQMSGIVESEFGYHIIKCTDEFHAPETVTGLDQLPEDLREGLATMLNQQALNNAYADWMQGLRDSATIEITDMPSNVSYNVDLSSISN